ncbi:LysR substrate-binding domain-containing protein [Pseudogemmobacter sonorensis]|uniref:LysR substrate-binding domain-containing protein n=1 Tax=Pseudogemmobacter sonorensis TaxID=2989681 RepID=UPI00368668D3
MNLSRSHIPDIAALQAFEAAARFGSFTLAATELNLSQSAVSRQIKDLETQLGLRLFDRVRQRVVLSENGRRLLPDVRRLLAQAEEMTLRALGSRGLSGMLSVATLPTFGSRWLMPRLPGFLARHPDTQINLSSRSAPFDFGQEPFDLAIHYGRPAWPHATCTFLCGELVLPVASPGLAAIAGTSVPDDLAALPLLHLDTRPRLWAQWFDSVGVEAEHAYRGHRFDQFAMAITAAIAGLGIALLPSYLIEDELSSGRLVVVANYPMPTDQGYYVVVPEGKSSDSLSSAFQVWLVRQVRSQPTGSTNSTPSCSVPASGGSVLGHVDKMDSPFP